MNDPEKPADKPIFVWCLHCERSYQHGESRRANGLQMCPYPDCDGDVVLDQWKWSRVRKANPSYPETPIRGETYPLYGTPGS